MFRNVAEVRQAEPDMSRFRQEWQRIQLLLESPTITEAEIHEAGIPEGLMFQGFRGYLNNRLVSGRLVRGRESDSLNVDIQFDTFQLREIQTALEQRIGRITMIGE